MAAFELFWHFLVRLDDFCILLHVIFQFSLNNLFRFMLVVALIWISRAEEGKLGSSGLTFLNPLHELGGLAEQAMNNAVLSITAMNLKVVSVAEHKNDI